MVRSVIWAHERSDTLHVWLVGWANWLRRTPWEKARDAVLDAEHQNQAKRVLRTRRRCGGSLLSTIFLSRWVATSRNKFDVTHNLVKLFWIFVLVIHVARFKYDWRIRPILALRTINIQ